MGPGPSGQAGNGRGRTKKILAAHPPTGGDGEAEALIGRGPGGAMGLKPLWVRRHIVGGSALHQASTDGPADRS